MPHHWTERDDMAALYVYRFGVEGTPYSIISMAESLGIGHKSFKMRLRNYLAIEGKGGLENYARQSRAIYERHGTSPALLLRDLAFPELKK